MIGDDGKKVGGGHARVFESHSRINRASGNFEAGQEQIRSVLLKDNLSASIVQEFWNPEPVWEAFFSFLFFFLITWFVSLLC